MQFKKILHLFIWCCFGFVIVCLSLYITLPQIAEHQIKKRLPRLLNHAGVEFDIQKIGIFNTHVSNIRISNGLSIDSINMGYRVEGLSCFRLNKLTLSGLRIHAGLDADNRIQIVGLDIANTAGGPGTKPNLSLLEDLPGEILLQNSTLVMDTVQGTFIIPFNVKAAVTPEDGKINIQVFCYPFGEKIHIRTAYDLNNGLESIKIEADSFDSSHLNPLLSKYTDTIKLDGPVNVTLETTSPRKKWQLNLSRLGITIPFKADVTNFSTTVLMHDSRFRVTGSGNISSPMLPVFPIEYGLTIDSKKANQYEFSLNTPTLKSYEINYDSMSAAMKNLQLQANLQGSLEKTKGNIIVKMNAGRIVRQTEKISFDQTEIRTNIESDLSPKGKGIISTLKLVADKINISSSQGKAGFPSVNISGEFGLNINGKKTKKTSNINPFAKLTLKASRGRVSSAVFKTTASGIGIEMPIQYPYTGKTKYGTYSIPKISYNNQYHFSTAGRLVQTGEKKIKITGGVKLQALPNLSTQFVSRVGFGKGVQASLDFKTNPVRLNAADIEQFFPKQVQGTEIDLGVFAKGTAQYRHRQLKTNLQLKITDSHLLMPDMNLSVNSINAALELNDLIVPESIPGQLLTIDSIEMNEIKINDVKVRFCIEDGKTLLIENILFRWCNGLVSSESIRFPQETNAYALTLYCDRLELAQLLKQMGAFHARGTGTLNGRIPIFYSDGNISFDNGFLFSTPGSGGNVIVANTERITAGIPMDSPQFSQLDLAREALKNYDYKWAKLIFNTFEDTLYVNMELDGKPSKTLPFEYKKELGRFVRVDASSPGSNFQGIKLDVNLKLPFNEVMKFGNKLKSILD